MDFSAVVDRIAEHLESRDAPFALAGAFALQAYGLQRATSDLDFIVLRSEQDSLVAFLESLDYETLYVSNGYSNHLHPEARGGRVDFIYVDDETAEKLFASTTRHRVGAHDLRVPRAEHLAAMKVHAMKNDPSRTFQELADIRFLLQLDGVDRTEIASYFKKAALEERYDELERTL